MSRVPKATTASRLQSQVAEIDEGAGVRRADTRPAGTPPAGIGQLGAPDPDGLEALAACQQRRRRCERDRIEAALDRLESGNYGYCAVCGEEIGLKRLEFDPAAVTCIRCAGRSD